MGGTVEEVLVPATTEVTDPNARAQNQNALIAAAYLTAEKELKMLNFDGFLAIDIYLRKIITPSNCSYSGEKLLFPVDVRLVSCTPIKDQRNLALVNPIFKTQAIKRTMVAVAICCDFCHKH